MSDHSEKALRALGPGDDCPPLDELVGGSADQLSADRRREVEAHVAGCAFCTAELALFHEFQEPASRPEEHAHVEAIVARLRQNSPVPQASWWQSFWNVRTLAPAALALAAVLVGVFVWAPGRTGSGTAPQVSVDTDVVRSLRVEVLSPQGTLSTPPAAFEWVALKGAVQYRVNLQEVDRTPLWSATTVGTTLPLPADIQAKVLPRKTLSWEVVALDETGAVVAASGQTRFVLAARPPHE